MYNITAMEVCMVPGGYAERTDENWLERKLIRPDIRVQAVPKSCIDQTKFFWRPDKLLGADIIIFQMEVG